jgi:hypothetical protein
VKPQACAYLNFFLAFACRASGTDQLIVGESVQNRYCDASGNFRETAVLGSKDCATRSGEDPIRKWDAVYRPNQCKNKYVLTSCTKGPCIT